MRIKTILSLFLATLLLCLCGCAPLSPNEGSGAPVPEEVRSSRYLYLTLWSWQITSPEDARAYGEKAKECGCGSVVSVMGRFYALDRDKNYDRMEKAYRAMVNGQGLIAKTAKEAILTAYERGETDEFITPTIIQQGKCEIVKIESGGVTGVAESKRIRI